MADQESPDQLTKIGPKDMVVALYDGWQTLFGGDPAPNSIRVLAAQWDLETAGGAACHCFNIGNIKKVNGDGHDFCMFRCWERDKQGKKYWIEPPDAGCRFRAFSTLTDGVADYLKMMNKRFKHAWPAVLDGDPEEFAKLLKEARYYTATLEEYTNAIKGRWGRYAKMAIHGSGGAGGGGDTPGPKPKGKPDPKPAPKPDPKSKPDPAQADAQFQNLKINSKASFAMQSGFVEFTAKDADGKPLKNWYFTLVAGDVKRTGQLDGDGHAKIDKLLASTCKLKLQETKPDQDPPTPPPTPAPPSQPLAGEGRAAKFRRMQLEDVLGNMQA